MIGMGRMTVGQLLDVFKNARNGDPKARTFAIRFERLARVRREKEHWKGIYTQELVRASLSLSFFATNLLRTLKIITTYSSSIAHRRGYKNFAKGPYSQGASSDPRSSTARSHACATSRSISL